MKHLKLIVAMFIATAIIFSCTKHQSYQQKEVIRPLSDTMTMTIRQVKDSLNIDLIAEYDKAVLNGVVMKKARPQATTLVVVWFHDLNASITGTTLTGDVSPDAYVAGAQKFIDTTTNTGAIGLWECNRSYSSPPGSGTTTSCQTQGSGFYRVFSADFITYNVHLSWFLQSN